MSKRPEKPAPRRSRPVQLADTIKEWVVEHELRAGDRLPGEAELMARYGRSKGTVREAMRILEAQGLVETRTGPGGGSFVGEVTGERARALLANYFYFRDLSISDIYQMRKLLEPEVAAELAGRLDAGQLAALEAVISEYPLPARDTEEERAQHVSSLKFHALLASYADNPLLAFVVEFMAQILTELTVWRRLYEPHNRPLWQKGRSYQIELVDALRKGDASRARAVMRAHMEVAETLMKEQEARVLRRFIAE
ncbi:FadR/GntR family transcriptional regulator [Salipiger abyssi]|uniref:FadR/GntR family transcriptional regulator n=1 Tax=Salipiger abyssi TaxID=1250539 RepID=UPI002E2C4F3F|nr:FCD domain-containing protein [Salipiger abyssi]